jgi:chromosome segregation ATPase
MGLLDGMFGKEEINQLKKRLVEKSDTISKIESQLAELIGVRISLEGELAQFQKIISEKNSSIQALNDNLNEYKNQRDSLISELQKNNQSLIDFKLQSELEINEANLQIEASQLVLQEALNESDLEVQKFAELQLKLDEKEAEFREREKSLAEKSDKLQSERQKFQQQATDLHLREQRWKNSIEPQLEKYESHRALDAREG